MPRVPTYDAPQESLRPLPGPRQDSVASPDLFGAQARNQQETGKALLATGTGVSAIAYRMKERDDADSVFRAETALKDEYLQYEQEVRKSRQGRFAKDVTVDTQKWWDERLKHHTENLGNGDQRAVFGQRATRLRQQSVHSVSQWESVQLERSHDESWQANKGATISSAAAHTTPESVDGARGEIDRLNRYQAVRKGWDAERLAAENLKDMTTLHTNVIQSLVRTDPVAAKAYFEKYKAEIDGTRHAEVGEFADRVTANAIGEKSAGEVWATIGPKSDRSPVELDKMEEQLRTQLKGNEPALDSAIKRLRERANAFKDARRERDEGMEANVNRAILNGASRAQIARMSEFNALSPEKARQIDAYMENKEYTRTARAAAEAQRADAEESRRQRRLTRDGLETALKLADPQRLAGMTHDQIVNLLPVLGAENTEHLLAKHSMITKSADALTEATIDKQLFDTIALERGLKPNEPKKGEEEKNQLLQLQNHVEAVIAQEQRKRQGKLSREEKGEIMRRELDNKVFIDTWFRDPQVAVPLATKDQIEKAYVIVGGKEIKLSSIPPAERANIAAAARRAGVTPTEQLIAEKWVQMRSSKAKTGTVPASQIPPPSLSDQVPR